MMSSKQYFKGLKYFMNEKKLRVSSYRTIPVLTMNPASMTNGTINKGMYSTIVFTPPTTIFPSIIPKVFPIIVFQIQNSASLKNISHPDLMLRK